MDILNLTKESKSVRLLLTIIIGMIGGLVFINIHMPLPWVLGPMTAVLIGSKLGKIHLYWSSGVRNWGLIIIGYASGLSFNQETLSQIILQLPWMLVMTIALIAFSAITAFVVSKLMGVNYPSVLTGCIPGGLTQMVTLGEEIEGMDMTVITFLQVMRLILIVFCVPLLIYSPLYSVEKSGYTTAIAQTASVPLNVLIPKIILFAIISVLCALLAKKLKFPTAYLLGPIIGIAVLNILGFHGPALSPILLDIAQFSMGCYLGLLLKPEDLQNKVKIISLSIINGIVLILFSLGLGYILVKMQGIGGTTGFLSMAPGGADQMGVVASVVSANVSMVIGYQTFRMLFVNIAVPPVLKWFYRYHAKKQTGHSMNPTQTGLDR